MSRWYVESASRSTVCNLGLEASAEDAVTVFFRDHPDLPDTTVVRAYVLDYIGDFQRETRVTRLPPSAWRAGLEDRAHCDAKPTKPDSPHGLAHPAVPPPRR